jgi:hypothetical protein
MNLYCSKLKIDVPSLETVKNHRDANTYSLLITALLECGVPMTLEDVADRFEQAGIAPASRALLSLKRCKPARPPVYRDGDSYELGVHDDELDLWLFRLGLRPPRTPSLDIVRPPPPPLPGPETPLAVEEIREAFEDAYLGNWSAQRLAIAVLDAHSGCLPAAEAVDHLNRINAEHGLQVESGRYWRSGAIRVGDDGSWMLNPPHDDAVLSARRAVRRQIASNRSRAARGRDPAVVRAYQKLAEDRQAARAAELAALRRVLIVAFPAKAPRAISLVDVTAREITTLIDQELTGLAALLRRYDFVGGLGVRPLLRALDIEPEDHILADLGPPQKTVTINRRGRTLKLTTSLFVQGSCGISRPFGDPERMGGYLRAGHITRFRRRLESDAKSLLALYQYGHLHHAYRVQWGFLDRMFRAPWVQLEEPSLYGIIRRAHEVSCTLDVVVGHAPGWEDPWARAVRCRTRQAADAWSPHLVGLNGLFIDPRDVQAVRWVRDGAD